MCVRGLFRDLTYAIALPEPLTEKVPDRPRGRLPDAIPAETTFRELRPRKSHPEAIGS